MTRIISIVGGMQPSAPTIGTATAGDTTASVAFTASSYIGKGTITYTATSSPGGLTATGASSPLTVTGLTNGTAYTFTVVGNTNYGVASVASSASNSITPAASGDFESIASVTVGAGGQSSIVFSSIPQTYTHLQIRGILRDSRVSSANSGAAMRFNGDTGSNYNESDIFGDSATILQAGASTASSLPTWNYTATSSTSGVFGMGVLDILYYSNTSVYKNIRAFGGHSQRNYVGYNTYYSGVWKNNAAVTSITFTPLTSPFVQYSSLALYGIK